MFYNFTNCSFLKIIFTFLLIVIFNKELIEKEDIGEAMDLINKTDAKLEAKKLGDEFNGKAKEALKKLPQNEWNTVLEEIADFVVKREK